MTLILWYAGVARVGVTRATVYSYLQPILGVAFAAALLGEQLSERQQGKRVLSAAELQQAADTLLRAHRVPGLLTAVVQTTRQERTQVWSH